jgi:hypothetical protein
VNIWICWACRICWVFSMTAAVDRGHLVMSVFTDYSSVVFGRNWRELSLVCWFVLSEPSTCAKWDCFLQMGWWHHIHDLWRYSGYSNPEQGTSNPFTGFIIELNFTSIDYIELNEICSLKLWLMFMKIIMLLCVYSFFKFFCWMVEFEFCLGGWL